MKTVHGFIVMLSVAGTASAAAGAEACGVDGGIYVQIGCDDPDALTALKADNCIVQGLATDQVKVLTARRAIAAKGMYGPVSAEVYDGTALPYISDTVNLLVVACDKCAVPVEEIQRVLCPGGVALVKGKKIVKPVPGNTSDWGHFLYDASGNAVSPDTAVDVPYNIQWKGGPKWARSHDRLSSLCSLVSSDGKIFYIFDEGMTEDFYYPPRWNMICRDAYNGIVLWKRDVGKWEDHWRAFRSGPTQLNRRVVSAGDKVYASLGLGQPIQVIDAANGKTIRTLKGTEGAEDIIEKDGVLYLIALPFDGEPADYQSMFKGRSRPGLQKKIMAVDTSTGTILWAKNDKDTLGILPVTLIVDKNNVYFQSRNTVIALDKKTGKQKWKTLRRSAESRPSNFTPALLVYKDVVISVDNLPGSGKVKKKGNMPAEGELREQENILWSFSAGATSIKGELVAMDAETGKKLWTTDAMAAYGAQMDCFVVNDLVYVGKKARRHTADFEQAHDYRTGEVRNEIQTASAFTRTHHHRCWRNKATCRYIIMGRTGIELIGFDGTLAMQNAYIRGNCEYGIMPANGMIYAPPHSCGCYIQVKLSGFFAFSPKDKNPLAGQKPENKLAKGPAFARVSGPGKNAASDWPTYRCDAARSGGTASPVGSDLKLIWKKKLPGRITASVVAGNSVFVAARDSHVLHALDRARGKTEWEFRAGARIDSPPTIIGNTLYFGSRDGWVYALIKDSGELAWKFRAAKSDRKNSVYGQLESVWPVHGSVLFLDGAIYFAAGRSSYLDDGLYIYTLDCKTGGILMEKKMWSRNPKTGDQEPNKGHNLPGGLNDILASDGETIFMRDFQMHLDSIPEGYTIKGVLPSNLKPRIHNTAGYLDDTWAHRTYWQYGTKQGSAYGGWKRPGTSTYSGRIMVRDGDDVYGYGRRGLDNDFRSSPKLGFYGKRDIHLYRASVAIQSKSTPTPAPAKKPAKKSKNRNKRSGKKRNKRMDNYAWQNDCRLHVRSMVLSKDKVLVAGTKDILRTEDMSRETIAKQEKLLGGNEEQYFEIYSKEDGKKIAGYTLPGKPIYDGMSIARGYVFISTEDDEILCFGPGK